MTVEEITNALSQGATRIGSWRVIIRSHRGRYVAYLTGEKYNTVVECPQMIASEGALSFYERIALTIKGKKP